MTLSAFSGPLGALTGRGPAAELARRLDEHPRSIPVVARLQVAGAQLASDIVPRERFRNDLRTRLLAVAAVQAATAAAAPSAAQHARTAPARTTAAVSWRSTGRAGGIAAGALASVVAVTGVAVAGSQSLPGDPFYGVKRQVEAFSLRTADGDLERGTRHLDHAATRLREVGGLVLGRDELTTGALVGSGDLAPGAALGAPVAQRVRETLADMDTATLRGQALLESAFRSSNDPRPLQALSRFATRQGDDLQRLLPALPPAARERALTSLALVDGVADDVDGLIASPPCGTACAPAAAAPSTPPVLPPVANPLEPAGPPAAGSPPCDCEPVPGLAPVPGATAVPGTSTDGSVEPGADPAPAEPARSPSPSPSPRASDEPGDPQEPLPAPSTPVPSPSLPLPLPLPLPDVPLPGVPPPGLPLPSPSLPVLQPLAPVVADLPLVSGLTGSAVAVLSPLVPRVLLGQPSQPAALPLWLAADPS